MKTNICVLFCIITTLISSCTSYEIRYVSEKENQLTNKEKQFFADKALVYAKENYKQYHITEDEANELSKITPTIRSYCKNYKYGEIFVSWELKSGKTISVYAYGHLLDPDTSMSIKVVRVKGGANVSNKELVRQYKAKRKREKHETR